MCEQCVTCLCYEQTHFDSLSPQRTYRSKVGSRVVLSVITNLGRQRANVRYDGIDRVASGIECHIVVFVGSGVGMSILYE